MVADAPQRSLVRLRDGGALEERLHGDAGRHVRETTGGQRRRAADEEVARAERGVLSDQDLADVYAFIKTFPEPQPVKDIPLLNQ